MPMDDSFSTPSPFANQPWIHCNLSLLYFYSFPFPGWILVDRSGKHFGTILNYLRDGSVPLPESKQHLEELLAETKFYLLEELSNEINEQLSKKKEAYEATCKVPLITSAKEEKLILNSTTKVGYSCLFTGFKFRNTPVLLRAQLVNLVNLYVILWWYFCIL